MILLFDPMTFWRIKQTIKCQVCLFSVFENNYSSFSCLLIGQRFLWRLLQSKRADLVHWVLFQTSASFRWFRLQFARLRKKTTVLRSVSFRSFFSTRCNCPWNATENWINNKGEIAGEAMFFLLDIYRSFRS